MSGVTYWKNLGRYDWASTRKDWCVSLHTPYGHVSDIWYGDDEPEIEDLLPTEVLDLIEARLTGRRSGGLADMEKIKNIRNHSSEINTTWLTANITALEGNLNRAKNRLQGYLNELEQSSNLVDDAAA